jgi:hypothetical protein
MLLGAHGMAQQAPNLPLGKPAAGTATGEAPAFYQFAAATAGVLSVAVVGSGDLALIVTDADGQAVAGGTMDSDLFGSTGTEQLLVTLPEPGTYRIQVRQQDSGPARFEIGGSWVSFPALARPADPDKRPSQARAVDVGRNHEDSLDAKTGDLWDWFVLTPKTAGALTVILRPVGADNQLDLTLELYAASDLASPTLKSDQDLQGHRANESITLDVTAGQKVYVKVQGGSSASGKYRLSSSLIQ